MTLMKIKKRGGGSIFRLARFSYGNHIIKVVLSFITLLS